MSKYIELIQGYAEIKIHIFVAWLYGIYAPWMALGVACALVIFVLLFIYTIWMWIFNKKVRWYHHLLHRVPVVKFVGKRQFKRGHYFGARWGMEEGFKLGSGGKRELKQRKISRALEQAGVTQV